MVFHGENEIAPSRVAILENHPRTQKMLSYRYFIATVDEPYMLQTSRTTKPKPLRLVSRRLREPLHQAEPLLLPDDEQASWALAAHYGLDHGRPMPRVQPNALPAMPEEEPEEAADVDEAQDGDKTTQDEDLQDVEQKELAALKLLHQKRRAARGKNLEDELRARNRDAGWILINEKWFYPALLNPSFILGVPPPPCPSTITGAAASQTPLPPPEPPAEGPTTAESAQLQVPVKIQ